MIDYVASLHEVFLHEIDHPAWNLCSYCLLNKTVSPDRLEHALNEAVRDNDALRMSVTSEGKASFFAYTPRVFERMSFSDENAFLTWAHQKANEPAYCYPGMWNAWLIEVGGQVGVFNVGHHLMCDALNVPILYRKIIEKLNGSGSGEYSYADHLAEQEQYRLSRQFLKDEAYWKDVLSSDIPLAFSAGQMGRCENLRLSLPDLSLLCEKEGISEAALSYTLTAVLLMRLCGIEALSLGIPMLGRTTKQEMQALGLFMNIVPMIIRGGDKSLIELAREVESRLMDLFRHPRYPMPQKPLFDVSVDYSVYPAASDYEPHVIYNDYLSTAMEFHFLRLSGELELTIRSRVGLFRDMSAIAKSFKMLVQGAVADPHRSIRTIALAHIDDSLHDVALPDESIYALAQTNHSGKIIEGDQTYTFADLAREAEKIDAAVRGTKRVIGVICDRSFGQLAAIYGVIRGGNAYLPIAADCPPERIRVMLEQSKCTSVLVQKKYASLAPDHALIIEDILSAPAPKRIPPISADPDDNLYVMFTSGSTGVPKGVMISNRSAANRVLWMNKRYFDADTVVMMKTPYTFDVSVWEIFGFALGGYALYILPPEDHYRQDKVIEHIKNGGVTDIHFVPTVFHEFLKAFSEKSVTLPSLKNFFLSGEALPAAAVNASPVPVHNLYGPTECAVDVTYYDCDETEADPVPIGKPIDNCGVYVLDQYLCPVPNGVEGQICVSGISVGRGYINDPQRTEEAFVPNPFGEGKLYLTGDIGYRRGDGNIIFVGRHDQQVKINGQRIELGEIEAALSRFVSPVAVLADNNRLSAFYCADEYPRLREELGKILPRHMIPHSFIRIDEMPYTSSGKIDRKALRFLAQRKSAPYRGPDTEQEKALILAVRKALHLPRVSMDDNFFELGGDSLSAIRVTAELEEQGYHLTITDFLKSATLSDASAKMDLPSSCAAKLTPDRSAVSPVIAAYLHERPDHINRFTQTVVIPVSEDEAAVRRALADVVSNHEMLRAVFSDDGSFSTGDQGFSLRVDSGEVTDDDPLIDIVNGPLICAVLYPGFLRLTIHHFIVDAVSWSIIIEDLRASLSRKPLLPEKATYRDWMDISADDTDNMPRQPMISLASEESSDTDEAYRFEIPSFLVQTTAQGFGVRVNELLLAALGTAANDMAGGSAGICVETYGRDNPLFGRTVGWFTDIFPTVIDGGGADAVFSAKKAIERIFDNTTGYLRFHRSLPDDASILFNYLRVPDGMTVGSFSPFPGKINVNCLELNDKIIVDILAPKGFFPRAITEKLGRTFNSALTGMAGLSTQDKQAVSRAELYTDSDLTLSEADEIRRSYDPEDVYGLTGAQKGMYDHWDSYRLRYVLRFDSPLDAARMEQSVSAAVQRHPALRSRIQKLSSGAVKQIVLKSAGSFFAVSDQDIKTFSALPHRADKSTLFKITLVRDYLVIDTHHMVVDGWSLAILARDIKELYDHPQAVSEPIGSFGSFTEWLKKRPDGISYWKSLLAGCGVSSDLPHTGSSVGKEHTAIQFVFCADVADFAVRNKVTENTVLEAAFSLLMLRHNRTAVFGKVLSGRNAPIPGIQNAVGTFINIVPVYIAAAADVIAQIHEQSIMTNIYGFTPLSEMYAQTELRRINILFVFENYPMETQIDLISSEEQTEFDLSFSVRKTDAGYSCRASFAPEKYDRDTVEEMLSDYAKIVTDLLDGKTAVGRISSDIQKYSAPIGDTEAEICRQFGVIVDQERVGRDDNYYDLGGTSLGMMEMLSHDPLSALSPSEFMSAPTPAGLARLLESSRDPAVLTALYEPALPYDAGIILFSYAGGDASAYTALIAEFRKRGAPVAVYYVPWLSEYETAARDIRKLSERLSLTFYSHCAGCVTAMKLLDILNAESTVVQKYYAAASIPPLDPVNIWRDMRDDMILAVLSKAGMPDLPDSRKQALITDFRSATSEYFEYMQNKTAKTPSSVSLIISRRDIFTPDHASAADAWKHYIQNVASVSYLDVPTHYFQSTNANDIANILLSED